MIEIPRCATCGRFEPILMNIRDDGVSEPICPLCMDEMYPVKWTVIQMAEGHYELTYGDYQWMGATTIRSGIFSECWNWVMANSPGMDKPNA